MATHMIHPEVGNWWYEMSGLKRGNDAPHIEQVDPQSRPGWVGKSVLELHQQDRVVTTAIKRNGEFLSPPSTEDVIQTDDILIVLAKRSAE
jgi:Trk K+ transport system NAD-binding subunit